ncbi:MAG: hypothetical protein ACO1RX_20710 [Candidatus Sericytochromatia bacterium]
MKFTTRPLSPVILTALLLSACGSPQPVYQAAAPQTMLQPVAQNTPTSVMADVGKGVKTPAQLSFRINLEEVGAFRTQASSAGVAAKTKDDLTHIKFYLVESDTGSPPTALGGTAFTYEISADNRTNNRVDITFTNVAANASGKSYYVLVAGFSSATATEANNITNFDAPIDDTTEGLYYVSNSGGSPAGAVRVTPVTYAISGATALGVPLKLLDAVSPVLDSDVTITAGDEISGTPTGNPG